MFFYSKLFCGFDFELLCSVTLVTYIGTPHCLEVLCVPMPSFFVMISKTTNQNHKKKKNK